MSEIKLKLEGQLSKYTNVMRGYQYRYFVVNSEAGKLDYYMSEDGKHQRPRGSIELQNAVISQSEEDSTTFLIQTHSEIFKLRALDAKERQHWVNVLRIVSQSFSNKEVEIPRIRSETVVQEELPVVDIAQIQANKTANIELVKEISNHVKMSHWKLEQLINSLPPRGAKLGKYDKDVLILKATARTCVGFITDCCEILKLNQKKKNLQSAMESLDQMSVSYSEKSVKSITESSTRNQHLTVTDLALPHVSTPVLNNGGLSKTDSGIIRANSSLGSVNSSAAFGASQTLPASISFQVNAGGGSSSQLSVNQPISTSHTNLNSLVSSGTHSASSGNLNVNTLSASNSSSSSGSTSNAKASKSRAESAEEVTDDDSYFQALDDPKIDYVQMFDDNKNKILHVLPNLKIGMDLTRVNLPTFLLESRSLLEMYADCLCHPDLFVKIADEKTPDDRMLSVLEWYLSSFHQINKTSLAKKPYNPIIGETFNCSWKVKDAAADESLTVTYSAEQVSHHPPITGFFVECKQKKMKLNASIYTKSKYLGMSISVQFIGEILLKLEKYNEEYVITLPNCYARSIVTRPWLELGDFCSIRCDQTGYNASIEFQVKPFYGDKSNQIDCEVRNRSDEVVCRAKGEWNGVLEYEYTNPSRRPKLVDTKELAVMRKRVRPLEAQEQNESRRVWNQVTQCLQRGDMDSASHYKTLIEKQQRTAEKIRRDQNIEFQARNFFKVKSNSQQQQQQQSQTRASSLGGKQEQASSGSDVGQENKFHWVYKNWF